MKKHFIIVALFLAVSGVLWAQQARNAAAAPPKYALVIGNGAYTQLSRLANPVNDATDVAAALQELGFTVDKVLNGSLDQMENAVIRLKNRLSVSKDSYGFLFYAGHGVQSGGVNYLIPVGANIPSESFLRERAVSVQAMLSELNDAGNSLNVVVLDACRDNPFGWGRSGSGRGLSVVSNQPADSIIVYATSAGSIASDGTDRNGLFTGQLLKNLKNPSLDVGELFRRTGADVAEVSGRKQIPAVYNQFFGVAYLGARPVVFEAGAVSTAVGSLEISTVSAGTVQIIGAAVDEQAEIPAWGSLPIAKIDAGNYRVVMRYEDGKVEEKTIQVERSGAAKLEFSYNPIRPQPLEPPKKEKREKREPDKNARLWTLGASVGTSFARPWVIGTVHGTVAPFNHSFFDIGLDVGMVSEASDTAYYSLSPFVHYAYFLPFSKAAKKQTQKGGWYIGGGASYMYAHYNVAFSEGKFSMSDSIFNFDVVTGFNLFNAFNISYTLRTNFSGVSNKLSLGYIYRF